MAEDAFLSWEIRSVPSGDFLTSTSTASTPRSIAILMDSKESLSVPSHPEWAVICGATVISSLSLSLFNRYKIIALQPVSFLMVTFAIIMKPIAFNHVPRYSKDTTPFCSAVNKKILPQENYHET